jgi:hypothetical protein
MADRTAPWVVLVLALAACTGGDPEVPREDARATQVAPAQQTKTAPASTATPAEGVRPVIGLVASEDASITAALAAGARRALDDARRDGVDLELRVAEPESQWAAAAETAVTMALDEGAVAIIAPPERERAHAIAQMGTRARVPIVSTSPWATVMQAGSTWVTSVVEPQDAPNVAPSDDWESAGYDAAHAVVEVVRTHGLTRRRWR